MLLLDEPTSFLDVKGKIELLTILQKLAHEQQLAVIVTPVSYTHLDVYKRQALTVAEGKMTATIVWSSPNYDYMIVDGEKYLPTNTEGNSTFEIPVSALDTAPVSYTHLLLYVNVCKFGQT